MTGKDRRGARSASARSTDLKAITSKLRRAKKSLPRSAGTHLLTIEEQLAAIGRGDFEAALGQADPELEFEIFAPVEFPFVKRARGVQDVRRAIEHNFGIVQDQQPEITNIVAQGDVVVLFGHERGTIRTTRRPYHVQFTHRFTFSNGALTHIQVIAARAD